MFSVAGCDELLADAALFGGVLEKRFGCEVVVEPLAQLSFRLCCLVGSFGLFQRCHRSEPRLHRIPIGVDVEHDGFAVGREIELAQQILLWERQKGLETRILPWSCRVLVHQKVHVGTLEGLGERLHLTWTRAQRRPQMNVPTTPCRP